MNQNQNHKQLGLPFASETEAQIEATTQTLLESLRRSRRRIAENAPLVEIVEGLEGMLRIERGERLAIFDDAIARLEHGAGGENGGKKQSQAA